jgi:hypothetical protein
MFFILVLILVSPLVEGGCPHYATTFEAGSKKYFFGNNGEVGWDTAKSYCPSESNSKLAVWETQEEFNKILEMASKSVCASFTV